jgi:hypothetical protein
MKTKTPRRTNAQMLFRVRSLLCEHHPGENRPAMLSDTYHAVATVQVGKDVRGWRVCQSCAARFFATSPQRPLRAAGSGA